LINSGFYLFEPNKDDIMKIAIHSVGYQHPRPSRLSTNTHPTFAAGERPKAQANGSASSTGDADARSVEPSDNATTTDLDHVAEPYIPETKVVDMLDELESVYPEIATYAKEALREGKNDIVHSRVCHYCDSADENWIIDWVEGVEGLLTATGDSGHGYKFLPIIGRLIAARMGVRDVLPLTAHQERVFSFAHHYNLVNKPRSGADSNRFKPIAAHA
jgi:sarcosine oxidase / L-pipecolate oxidase